MVEVTINITQIQRSLRGLNTNLNKAIVQALNDAAFELRKLWRADIRTFVDQPTSFTVGRQNVLVRKAKPNNLISQTFIAPLQARYLQDIVEGGVREIGDLAVTSLGSVVPDKAKLNRFGNFPGGPKRWLAGIEENDDYDGEGFVGTPGFSGEGIGPRPAVYERLSGGALRLLAVFEKTVQYDITIPLEKTVELTVDTFDQIFDRVIKKEIDKILN